MQNDKCIEDIIKNKDFILDINSEAYNKEYTEEGIVIKYNFNPKAGYEGIYYWYDHMMRVSNPALVHNIEMALQKGDWDSFSKFYYDNSLGCTLPYTIAIFTKEENFLIGHLTLNKHTFKYITFSEYECG